jgi:4,5-DOPA dioxygenase extradiol
MIAVSSHQLPRLLAADHQPLVNYESLGRDALLSIPTADHYLPLLSVLGTRVGGERLGFPVKGVDGGSISMLAAQIG